MPECLSEFLQQLTPSQKADLGEYLATNDNDDIVDSMMEVVDPGA